MEVSEALKQAWDSVLAANLPENVRVVAFTEAIRLHAGTAAVAPLTAVRRPPKPVGASGQTTVTVGDDDVTITEDEMYQKVVEQTGVDLALLERVVHLDDDGPRISIAGLKLGRSNSERARAVAKVITIVRGFGLDENETPLEVIRDECERLKVYDIANFSTHMKALDGFVINGTGSGRRLRPKGPGIAGFASLVEKIVGDA